MNSICNLKNVTKSNELIRSCYSFSLLEQQILVYIISKVDPYSEAFPLEHKIEVREFIKTFNKSNKNIYKDIEDAISNKFWSKEIAYWDYIANGYIKIRWFSMVFYSRQQGYFKVGFSPYIQPFLHQLKTNFTTYSLFQIVKFKSSFSIRIYEICVSEINKKKAKKCDKKLSLITIKEQLNLEKKYPRYNNFKQFVLEKAKIEINRYSDLNIDFTEIYQSRTVKAIMFNIERKSGTKPASYAKPKNQLNITEIQENPKLIDHAPDQALMSKQENTHDIKSREIEEQDDKMKDSINSLNNLGVNHKQAAKYVKEYGTEAVNIAIEQTLKASEKAANDGKTINNIAAYVVKCLKNSSEVLTLNSDDIHAHKQAEKEAKQKALIDRELRWIKLDRWCSEYQEQIIPIIQKHMSGEAVTDYQDYLFLKECAETVSKHLDIIDYPLLLTDVFLDTNGKKLCFTLKSFHKILLEMVDRKE